MTGDPTIEQMKAALGDRDETFALGGTIRRCRVCTNPTFGGPTLCDRCGSMRLSRADLAAIAGQWKASA